jgi:hypothetical protein
LDPILAEFPVAQHIIFTRQFNHHGFTDRAVPFARAAINSVGGKNMAMMMVMAQAETLEVAAV